MTSNFRTKMVCRTLSKAAAVIALSVGLASTSQASYPLGVPTGSDARNGAEFTYQLLPECQVIIHSNMNIRRVAFKNANNRTIFAQSVGRGISSVSSNFGELLKDHPDGQILIRARQGRLWTGLNKNVNDGVAACLNPNNPPVANAGFFTIDGDEQLTFGVDELAQFATDVDGDQLFISIPDNDVLTVNVDGTYTYDPTDEFGELPVGEVGTKTFAYEVSDGEATVSGTITINVQGVDPGDVIYQLGDRGPGGGTVFRVTDDGTNGLEFAPHFVTNPSSADGTHPNGRPFGVAWGCDGENIPGMPLLHGFDPDTGEPNQEVQAGILNQGPLIDAQCNAGVLADSYTIVLGSGETVDDWYLPSITELTDIIGQNGSFTLPEYYRPTHELTFDRDWYIWSSTEHTSGMAWAASLSYEFVYTPVIQPKWAEGASRSFLMMILPVRSF